MPTMMLPLERRKVQIRPFCRDTAVTHHGAKSSTVVCRNRTPWGKRPRCFYLPGNLWSHLLKNFFVLTTATACLPQAGGIATRQPLCQFAREGERQVRQQPHRGLQEGSFKHAEHAQKEKTTGNLAGWTALKKGAAAVIGLPAKLKGSLTAPGLLGAQSICCAGAVTVVQWPLSCSTSSARHLHAAFLPRRVQIAAKHTDKPLILSVPTRSTGTQNLCSLPLGVSHPLSEGTLIASEGCKRFVPAPD